MCNPLAIAALQIGQAILGHRQQANAAKAQDQAIRQSAEMQNIQTAHQYAEQNQATMEQTSQRHTEWLRDLGRLRAVGAESGLFGSTQQRLEDEATNAASYDIATLEANRFKASQQVASGAKAQNMQANAHLKSIKRPSLIGTGLQIGGAVAEYAKKPEAKK